MSKIKTLLRNIPGVYRLYRFFKYIKHINDFEKYLYEYPNQIQRLEEFTSSPFLTFSPPGHFYSPIPKKSEIKRQKELTFKLENLKCHGVDLREKDQLELLLELSTYYDRLQYPDAPSSTHRYYYQNDFFSYADSIILNSMLCHFKPKRLIEVGSGFSSAAMLDTNDRHLKRKTLFTFIEPYPDRLFNLLSEEDKKQQVVIQKNVQEVEISIFTELEENDILFIDSSHIVKIGSDVIHLLFQIMPQLKPGVIVHFHDIFYPFEYPYQWFEEGRAWNEIYCLRAFLQYNTHFQIIYFNSFMELIHKELLESKMPLCLTNSGSSLWLRKNAEY